MGAEDLRLEVVEAAVRNTLERSGGAPDDVIVVLSEDSLPGVTHVLGCTVRRVPAFGGGTFAVMTPLREEPRKPWWRPSFDMSFWLSMVAWTVAVVAAHLFDDGVDWGDFALWLWACLSLAFIDAFADARREARQSDVVIGKAPWLEDR